MEPPMVGVVSGMQCRNVANWNVLKKCMEGHVALIDIDQEVVCGRRKQRQKEKGKGEWKQEFRE